MIYRLLCSAFGLHRDVDERADRAADEALERTVSQLDQAGAAAGQVRGALTANREQLDDLSRAIDAKSGIPMTSRARVRTSEVRAQIEAVIRRIDERTAAEVRR